jgi:hypothetical protein
MMTKFTTLDTKTNEVLAVTTRMAGSMVSVAQAEASSIDQAAAAFRATLEVTLAAQGKGISTYRTVDAADGRFLIQETGRRFNVAFKSFVIVAPQFAREEYAENLTADARRLKYGR